MNEQDSIYLLSIEKILQHNKEYMKKYPSESVINELDNRKYFLLITYLKSNRSNDYLLELCKKEFQNSLERLEDMLSKNEIHEQMYILESDFNNCLYNKILLNDSNFDMSRYYENRKFLKSVVSDET